MDRTESGELVGSGGQEQLVEAKINAKNARQARFLYVLMYLFIEGSTL